MRLDFRLELREVVDGALAVCCGDYNGGVEPEVLRDLAPCSLDCRNGIGKCTILWK